MCIIKPGLKSTGSVSTTEYPPKGINDLLLILKLLTSVKNSSGTSQF
jgi:hypothetical protein